MAQRPASDKTSSAPPTASTHTVSQPPTSYPAATPHRYTISGTTPPLLALRISGRNWWWQWKGRRFVVCGSGSWSQWRSAGILVWRATGGRVFLGPAPGMLVKVRHNDEARMARTWLVSFRTLKNRLAVNFDCVLPQFISILHLYPAPHLDSRIQQFRQRLPLPQPRHQHKPNLTDRHHCPHLIRQQILQ